MGDEEVDEAARSRRQLVNGCDPTRELVGRSDTNEVRQKRAAEQSIQRGWFRWQLANVARLQPDLVDHTADRARYATQLLVGGQRQDASGAVILVEPLEREGKQG